jgi:hypothetical protein
MVFLIAFLGFLAFLSGYTVSLEDRFQRDGLFCPFSLIENLKASPEARKFFTWFGIALWGLAAVCYFFVPPEAPLSERDTLKCLSAVFMLYSFMFIGYAREIEFRKTGQSANTIPSLKTMSRREMQVVSIRAGVAVGKILFLLMSLGALKWIVHY